MASNLFRGKDRRILNAVIDREFMIRDRDAKADGADEEQALPSWLKIVSPERPDIDATMTALTNHANVLRQLTRT